MSCLLQFAVLRLLVPIVFVLACTSAVVRAQDPWTHFGDKHVGGDVPFDESAADAAYRRQLPEPREGRVLKTGPLAVPKSDRVAFASFLRAPDTGLICLLPPAAAYTAYIHGRPFTRHDQYAYSFANLTHAIFGGPDITLNEDKLSTGSVFGYGMMVNIGDVALEQLNLADWRTKFLADYQHPVTIMFARDEASRFKNPVTVDGLRYENSLPVELNSTYLLRSINYGRLLFAPVKTGDESKPRARRSDV